jgi:Ca-activated chloride channel homolog
VRRRGGNPIRQLYLVREQRTAIMLLTALLFGSSILLAPQERQLPTLRVSVSLVTVGVRVTDLKGNSVANLQARDFVLYEDGVAQEIAFFANVEQPLSLGILLDRSDSMKYADKLERAKTAARLILDASHGESEYLYIPFDGNFDSRVDFSPDRDSTARAIAATGLGGGTSLYDAVIHAIDRCRHAKYGRQALVIITDGTDQHSIHTLDQMIAAVQESQAQLFTMGYFSPNEEEVSRRSGAKILLPIDQVVDNPRLVFKRLADQTGAAAFFPRSDSELQNAVQRIVSDLRTQYTLAYYPSNATPSARYRRITVKIRQPNLRVRARRGYLGRPSLP